ncbi:hypothetical protein ACROYT_G002397 [Oculina patagonica]
MLMQNQVLGKPYFEPQEQDETEYLFTTEKEETNQSVQNETSGFRGKREVTYNLRDFCQAARFQPSTSASSCVKGQYYCYGYAELVCNIASFQCLGNVPHFNTDCFYCGNEIDFEEQKKKPGEVFRVTTLKTRETVLEACSERRDFWAEVVQARISNVYDLPAAGAVYHQLCSVNFRTKKQMPKVFSASDQLAFHAVVLRDDTRSPPKNDCVGGYRSA